MKKIANLAFAAAACLLLTSGAATAGDDHDYSWQDGRIALAGAWQTETTIRFPADDCTTSPMVPPFAPNPFPSFSTFHLGGTMNEHGSRSSPAMRSPGFGVWDRIGRRKYESRFKFHSFDENGLLAATMEFRTQLRVAKNGETFEGVSRLVRTDISGNVLTFCATMTGERIVL